MSSIVDDILLVLPPHLRLYHQVALRSDVCDVSEHINLLFFLDLIQNRINCHVRTSTAYSCSEIEEEIKKSKFQIFKTYTEYRISNREHLAIKERFCHPNLFTKHLQSIAFILSNE